MSGRLAVNSLLLVNHTSQLLVLNMKQVVFSLVDQSINRC